MDSFLGGLFGGQGDDTQQRGKAQDFVNRYEQGAPWDNISDDEAVQNYQAVAGQMSPEELEDSAAQTYERLSPEERQQFARWLQEQGGDQGTQLNPDDPRQMAHATARVQQNQPDGLMGLLGGSGLLGGGGSGGGLGNLLGGGNSTSGAMQSPIAKAVLGGIAAMAMKKMMGNR